MANQSPDPKAPAQPAKRAGYAYEPIMWMVLGGLLAVPAAVLVLPDARPIGIVLLVGCGLVTQVGAIAEGVLVGLRSYEATR